MADDGDRNKLTRALARLVALRKQLQERREALQAHASDQLDATNHAIRAGSEAMGKDPNALVHRWTRTRMTEGAILRGVALRAEADRNGRG